MIALLSIFKRRPRGAARLKGSPAQPHRIRLNGHSAGVLTVKDGGKQITVCVFQSGHEWEQGDYVLFERRNGETTRYTIDRIETPRDPGDQHFLYCTFAPRTEPSPTHE